MDRQQHWRLEDIPWARLKREAVADNETLFYMVSTASLIESTTHLYSSNLAAHFTGDDEVEGWLREGWETEELQHGRALREYCRHAWPELDWDALYEAFLSDYGAHCKLENLLPLRSLELVSRCVVEMGTSCYYTALSQASADPVLEQVARHIYTDEIGHYKHFYKYFLRYREQEQVGRAQVLGALWHRLKMLEDEDTYIALKHVYAVRQPGRPYGQREYKRLIKQVRALASRHFPHQLSAKMLLKPLDVAPAAQRVIEPLVEGFSRLVA
jgi:hypothetical protein